MSKLFVLLLMVFCHIVDDYYLQAIGPLASMKQRKWWEENYPQKQYKYDYLVALIMHSISWAFMIMLPISFYHTWDPPVIFYVEFAANIVVHAVTDHAKANDRIINLVTDQTIHMAQIFVTYLACILCC